LKLLYVHTAYPDNPADPIAPAAKVIMVLGIGIRSIASGNLQDQNARWP